MSVDTTLTIKRSGTTLQQGVPAQVDELSIEMAAYYGGSQPYDMYTIYVKFATLAYNRNDLIVDETQTDPLTNKAKQYRVVGVPRAYPDGHTELVADIFLGTGS